MKTLIIVLVVLFLALLILVPVLEKLSGKGRWTPNPGMTRWIFPLMALVLLLQLFRHYFG